MEGNSEVTQPVKDRLVELEKLWQTLKAEVEQVETVEVNAFNALLQKHNVPGVIGGAKKKGPIA